MRINIQNNWNIVPIVLHLFWISYVFYFFVFRIKSFSNETPCGAGTLMVGLPIVTVVFTIVSLLLVSILNVFKRKKIYTDHEFISIPFFLLITFFIIYMFV